MLIKGELKTIYQKMAKHKPPVLAFKCLSIYFQHFTSQKVIATSLQKKSFFYWHSHKYFFTLQQLF